MKRIVYSLFLFINALSTFSQSESNVAQVKMVANNSNPLIVGHRGGFDSNLPENSIALFDFALSNSCRKSIGIELDIRENKSGNLYVMHDATIDRTTNGTGKISLLTDSCIESVFLKDRDGKLTSEKVPLFSDVLRHFQNKNCILMLDVKGNIYPKVISMVAEMKMESKCILLTFDLNTTKLVKEKTSQILISALILNKAGWESVLKLQIPNQQLIAYVSSETSKEIIAEIHKSDVLLMTDMSESIKNNSKYYETGFYRKYLMEMHLDIIITDFPVYVSKLFCED